MRREEEQDVDEEEEEGWRLCFPLWHVLHAYSPEKINIAYAQHVAICHCRQRVTLSVCECVRVIA